MTVRAYDLREAELPLLLPQDEEEGKEEHKKN